MSESKTPERCCFCGADRQIHAGHGRHYRRGGWWWYECTTRWHPDHGWSRDRSCELRTAKAALALAQPVIEAVAEFHSTHHTRRSNSEIESLEETFSQDDSRAGKAMAAELRLLLSYRAYEQARTHDAEGGETKT